MKRPEKKYWTGECGGLKDKDVIRNKTIDEYEKYHETEVKDIKEHNTELIFRANEAELRLSNLPSEEKIEQIARGHFATLFQAPITYEEIIDRCNRLAKAISKRLRGEE